ncbi:MAG: hypothetical protein E7417_01985 [Ruminococcaceae bacterium]|nr:hypothetical protein [Oscillospiraceae bacterium]
MRPNYSDYQLLFGDFTKIPESGFDRWMIRSIGEINRYLCRPLEEIEEEDKNLCIFEVAECLYLAEENRGIKAENTDGYSVSYAETGIDIMPILRRYLPKYLYRGVDL